MPRAGDKAASRQKSCVICTRGKRRCDLRHPACGRCVSKGLSCYYPSTRLHHGKEETTSTLTAPEVRAPLTPASTVRDDSITATSRPSLSPSDASSVFAKQRSNVELGPFTETSASNYQVFFNDALQDDLHRTFQPLRSAQRPATIEDAVTRSDTWSVIDLPAHSPDTDRLLHLKQQVQRLQGWLREWHLTGSTPYIHHKYYSDLVPRCVQDAYTASTTYYASTEASKNFVLRIIELRVNQMVDDPESIHPVGYESVCGLWYLVARLHAMIAYQIIRLFDGDIRQRALAEETIPVIEAWNKELLDKALASSHFVESFKDITPVPTLEQSWEAWILAETIRRTWITCSFVHALYNILKGGPRSCTGPLQFTARKGLWDARSAGAWSRLTSAKDPLLFHSRDGADIISRAKPSEVDEFAMLTLQIVTGKEAVEEWTVATTTPT